MTVASGRLQRAFWCGLVLLVLCPFAAAAEPRVAASATDELRAHFDRVLTATRSPSFRAMEHDARRAQIRRLTAGLFNWSEISRRALGAEWRAKSAAERREFASSFASMVEAAYMGQLDHLSARGIPRNAVRFLGETTNGGETTVRTMLRYPDDTPIDFVMSRRAARWEVHDVVVGGVSAAENYGAQFRRVMTRDSFAGLVDRMTARTAATTAASAAAVEARPASGGETRPVSER